MNTRYLVLEDGHVYPGKAMGSSVPFCDELYDVDTLIGAGETVFNTCMSGYYEILTDPSYTGQLVVMTYPHIGNYGTCLSWSETHASQASRLIQPAGLVVKDCYRGPLPTGRESLDVLLAHHGIPGITAVDTRRLTIDLRTSGSRNGVLAASRSEKITPEELSMALQYLSRFPSMDGRSLLPHTGIRTSENITETGSPHFAVIDCGIKEHILQCLADRSVRITLVPASITQDELMSLKPDACLISNGPGDPAVYTDQTALITSIMETIPLFGICLGHQLISLALGARTYKMDFGHHGGNHPVLDKRTGKVFVTSQNHGFAVDHESIPPGTEVWMVNANDRSIEGLYNRKLGVSSVQFHPEASPGPQDSSWIFDTFIDQARSWRN